ncbi:MAG TPA: pilus assembly PilX N-terminal domain-containing protein, partial [Albitalea sp.]|nr:pilus assembly PilX N-terminal domain-containing protein [Albitalea sp.]
MKPLRHPRQHGAAALVVTLVLFFVMTLVAGHAHRNHVFEQRASANQYRATQAFEAAEAGLEWAIAMLNDPRPIGSDCRPQDDGGRSFRERHLKASLSSGEQTPLADAGMAACVRDGTGWRCSCPAAEAAPTPSDDDAAPAFIVRFAAAPQAGSVQLLSTGCSQPAGACIPGDGAPADATARLQVTLALVPALATPPVAPLTTRAEVSTGAALGLHNGDAATGGAAVHAGGAVIAPAARLGGPAGAPGATLIEHDASLNALADPHFFASFFGLDKATWNQQPGVTRLRCDGRCGDPLLQAIGRHGTHRMLWIDGDLALDGVLSLGTREKPVLIVASGAIRFSGPVRLHGVVYGTRIDWHGSGGALHGAAISEGGYSGSGTPDFVYDGAVLAALRNG